MSEDSLRRRLLVGSLCIVVLTATTSACASAKRPRTVKAYDEKGDGHDSKPPVNRYGSPADVSGFYRGSGDGANMLAMGQWMKNSKVQWAGDYADSDGPSPWQIGQWQNIEQPHVLWSVAFLPTIAADRASNPAGWLAEVERDMVLAASGAYDQRWLDMGRRMASTSRQGKDAIRIGWELSGDWFRWGSRVFPGAGALQKQAWQHYALAIRASGWQVKTVWDSEDLSTLPNPSLIDVINTGGYDRGGIGWAGCGAGGHNPDGTWRQPAAVWACREQGMGPQLQQAVDLARATGKPLAISEWGLSYGNDDTYFVQAMYDFIATNDVLFAIYFDGDNSNVSTEMHDLDHFPQGKALFRKLFTERGRLAAK